MYKCRRYTLTCSILEKYERTNLFRGKDLKSHIIEFFTCSTYERLTKMKRDTSAHTTVLEIHSVKDIRPCFCFPSYFECKKLSRAWNACTKSEAFFLEKHLQRSLICLHFEIQIYDLLRDGVEIYGWAFRLNCTSSWIDHNNFQGNFLRNR